MTPDELRALAYAATRSYPDDGIAYRQGVFAREWLTASAPDLARLCAEMGEALERIAAKKLAAAVGQDGVKHESSSQIARAALVKLAKLKP